MANAALSHGHTSGVEAMSAGETLTIRAEQDPGLLMRVAALIAVDNTIPDSLCAVCSADGELHITVVLGRTSADRADYLATKIESTIASVIEIRRDRAAA
jgi:hypothetical protein